MSLETNLPGNSPETELPEITVEGLPERLRAAVDRAGWTTLMPVQARGIPYLLAGQDMIVQARTGSGKTGAFLLPLLERLDPEHHRCQALILVPTRELAQQVAHDAEVLCAQGGFKTAVVYGGVSYGPQVEALKGGAQIVIGTPGRVLDHLLKRTFNLEELAFLIFDEADRMLSMGFYPDMKRMQRYLPKRRIQACMFSATFPSYVLRTAREFIPQPQFLTLSRDQVHATDVEHLYYDVPGLDKDRALVRLIEVENPVNALIFCNTKARVAYVSTVLQRFGYDADDLSADRSQKDRERVLGRVRQGTLRFLVATDVAARGIDIPDLSHVFHYEPPEDPEAYVHRSGRTGRAGASGTVISLVTEIEKLALKRIAQRYSIEMEERPLPTDEDVAGVVSQRLTVLLEARLRERDKLHMERGLRFIPLARSLAESEDESALIAMLLDEYYQQVQHAPLVLPPDAPPPRGSRPQAPARAPHTPPARPVSTPEPPRVQGPAAEPVQAPEVNPVPAAEVAQVQGSEAAPAARPARPPRRRGRGGQDGAPPASAPVVDAAPAPEVAPADAAPADAAPAPAATAPAPAATAPAPADTALAPEGAPPVGAKSRRDRSRSKAKAMQDTGLPAEASASEAPVPAPSGGGFRFRRPRG